MPIFFSVGGRWQEGNLKGLFTVCKVIGFRIFFSIGLLRWEVEGLLICIKTIS